MGGLAIVLLLSGSAPLLLLAGSLTFIGPVVDLLIPAGSERNAFGYVPVERRRASKELSGVAARTITNLAAVLAGQKRAAVREEWPAHLAGVTGHEPPTWRKLRIALGFIFAAIRYRMQDATDAAWIPADALLKSRTLSNLFVFTPTLATAQFIFSHGGTYALATGADSVIALGGMLYGAVRAGRWWRGVKPPKHEPKRARE